MAKSTHDARHRRVIDCLAQARRSAGLTQTELATRLATRQQFLSKYEAGERRLDVIEFVDIVRALGLGVANLVSDIPAR